MVIGIYYILMYCWLGETRGSIHNQVAEEYKKLFMKGSVLLLRNPEILNSGFIPHLIPVTKKNLVAIASPNKTSKPDVRKQLIVSPYFWNSIKSWYNNHYCPFRLNGAVWQVDQTLSRGTLKKPKFTCAWAEKKTMRPRPSGSFRTWRLLPLLIDSKRHHREPIPWADHYLVPYSGQLLLRAGSSQQQIDNRCPTPSSLAKRTRWRRLWWHRLIYSDRRLNRF